MSRSGIRRTKSASGDFPVRTLFQELYEGDYTQQSFLFGYLRHIPTHSHVHAPVAALDRGPFPVLLFNHALELGFTSQNQLLMEHLASHGYVIFSIAHPYQSAKVNLGSAGTVSTVSEYPSDMDLPRAELFRGVVGTIYEASHDLDEISAVKEVLSPLAEQYFALDERDKKTFLSQAVAMEEFARLPTFHVRRAARRLFPLRLLCRKFHASVLGRRYSVHCRYAWRHCRRRSPGLRNRSTPADSVFSACRMAARAAGEFCKIDDRCKAGANLDGTQFGRHWNQAVSAPFLMLYNEEHQGGNDFAYLPPTHDFWDYGVKGATHFDFTDFTYVWPLFKTLGFTGPIDGMRMIDIMNIVVLSFFDHSLKGKPDLGRVVYRYPGDRRPAPLAAIFSAAIRCPAPRRSRGGRL